MLERAAGAHDLLALLQAGQHQGLRGIDARRGLPDQALDERRLRDLLENAWPGHAPGVAGGLGEGIERALRHADDRRDQRGRTERRIAEASLMIPRHLEPRHLAGKDRADRQHAVLRNEDRIGDRDGLRSGALEPAHVPAVVIDHHVADRYQAPGQRRRRTALPGSSAARMSQAGAVDAAGPRPTAGNLVAAVDFFDLRRRRVGDGEEVVRIVPDLLLRLERKERRHPAEADRERPAPAGAAAGAPEFEADLCKLRWAVLVAAEALGLHGAEDIRVAQRLHGFGGHPFGFFGRQRPRCDLGAQLADPTEDLGKFRAASPRCLPTTGRVASICMTLFSLMTVVAACTLLRPSPPVLQPF